MRIATLSERTERRRLAVVAAARACFLRYGYAKTSLNDIAKEARISRPLLYLVYKNKEAMFKAVFEALYPARFPAVERVVSGRGPLGERLFEAYEKLVLEPWGELFGMPAAAEFAESAREILPLATAAYARRRLRYTQDLLGDRELAEVFALAVDGLMTDRPSTTLLRKRLQILVARFVSAHIVKD
jgi:AcrR family transcriptional regulator